MKKLHPANLAIALLLALSGCAATAVPTPQSHWSGLLNMRGGASHEGGYLLGISASSPEIVGDYLYNAAGCMEKGKVTGVRSGREMKMIITDGVSEMEIKAAVDGGVLYGRYEFIRGPCKGDWGSTMATPAR